MDYISTRGAAPALDFAGATLAGLASDGGLYVPREWPRFTEAEIAEMAGLPYAELAQRVMQPFVGDCLTPQRLLELTRAAYGRFAHAAVTPLVQLDEQQWLLELFHGPTLAFKDVALQLLGLLFEEFLGRSDQHLTIVGATSGDTGSAAIDAVAGRSRVDIFMLHPKGRVSDVQRRQMTTVLAPNVHNIAIENSSFDDAQAMVKRMFNDSAMTGRFAIGAVNSINWARLMAQVVYYFAAALQLGAPARKVAFAVPTGNFGDVFAGYVAAQMGLPVERLIVATNVNDILHRALSTGDYSQGTVTPTAAPSMDIQVSSNFERLLFDVGGRDGAALAEQMRTFEKTRAMQLTNAQREGAAALFCSARADADDMTRAIRRAYVEGGQVIDPHTAIGLHAARAAGVDRSIPVVTLATAHPAKFRDAVEQATGLRPTLPTRVGDLFQREERCASLPGDYAAVADYVAAHATPYAAPTLMARLAPAPLILAGEGWRDYALVDSGEGRKLERYGAYRFIRPEPQALWRPRVADWSAHGEFIPGSDEDGGGRWHYAQPVPREGWELGWPHGAEQVRFTASCTPFRHLGFFPDMAPVWSWMSERLAATPDAATLNLFGYTGVGTLALSAHGPVTHVDASKKSVAQARLNAQASGMADRPVRWIVDDASKFAAREVRRGRRYDGIILDPPKFGRGPEGEVWRLEEHLPGLIADCRALLDANSRFLFLTVYAVRMSSLALAGLLDEVFADLPGVIEHGDLAVREEGDRGRLLPTAIFARWRSDAE